MKSESHPQPLLQTLPELTAPPAWRRLAFVSDLHLGPEAPVTTAGFLRWLRGEALAADALFILGDLFEAWVGDDLLDAAPPDAHHQVCAALAAYAASGHAVRVMHGNRDFLLQQGFARRCGAPLLPDPCVLVLAGQRILLTHGDALCISDAPYLQWRALCRSADWQARFLAQPLQARIEQAATMRAQSRAAQSRMDTWSDADPAEAARWLQAANSTWMIHGHTHRPREHWDHGQLRQVLSDWDLDAPAGGAAHRAQALWLHAGGTTLAAERRPAA
ncbi:UDP-2,3-diacylglucosamine diphosphatase [Thiomonas sp. X19]|uniref:UDP-2,3-diacylglucosamine diphosphatase n=1 Tax=Thiomonas sp. X19 TaxID=1050370 RepID=UPI000DDBBF1B|nr:UDP-2,3-diacylglucosamine diphosphatase [Thiomonas sp. X19]